MISAVFFPSPENPEILMCGLQATALQAMRSGLRLYTNGQRWALLPRPLPGWALFVGGFDKCAA